MHKRATTSDTLTMSARPFFSDFAKTTPFFTGPSTVQTKAGESDLENGEALLRATLPGTERPVTAEGPTPPPADEPPTDPASTDAGSAVQTKLTVGRADD